MKKSASRGRTRTYSRKRVKSLAMIIWAITLVASAFMIGWCPA